AAALFAGAGGLEIIERIVAGSADRLAAGGLLALEIGAGQGADVLALLDTTGRYVSARVQRDLAGRDRMALAETQSS
ncbi:MAG: peptide chain release factor N(5)-glutamine methyltransferase, partial [Gemmatimonadetes bacterium]|nr:peptide chain release factor N(5)-glutamine methyltransferase [Gemmatimonadota bacterium]